MSGKWAGAVPQVAAEHGVDGLDAEGAHERAVEGLAIVLERRQLENDELADVELARR